MFQATPTLIVGLGGTGLKVVTLVKKSLLEASQNVLPTGLALLVLDTEAEVKYQAGGWGQVRNERHATGPVKMTTGEYVPLTGDVKSVGLAVKNEQIMAANDPAIRRSQPNRHISHWFQGQYYLDAAGVDDAVWSLSVGAGQFRQFGRLGLFAHVPQVVRDLKSSMSGIQQQAREATLYVHVVGSLAGGTGAALLLDLPHLIKEVATQAGFAQPPIILGHFVLAEGFRGTPEVSFNESGVQRVFKARTLAALRELTRLQGTVVIRSGGYPLVYDPTGVGEMNSRLAQNLYSAVYLYDGIRSRNRLNNRPIEAGLAPTIADAITAYVDDRSGGAFCSHSVNYRAFYPAYQIPAGKVTYGSVGTYTIELPIYHITEGWTHDLALEVLGTLLDPLITDGEVVTSPANKTSGAQDDPQKAAAKWLFEQTTALVGQLAEWGQATQTTAIRQQTVDRVLNLDAAGWQQKLAPPDAKLRDYVTEATDELEASLRDEESRNYYVDLSTLRGTKEKKAIDLQNLVDEKLLAMVGKEQDVWMRQGGNFRAALAKLGNHHVGIFEQGLIKWLTDHLNGSNVGDPVQNKSSKLAFALTFMEAAEKLLRHGSEVVREAEKQGRTKRRTRYNALAEELKNANDHAREGAGFLSRNYKSYVEKADELAQFHKADIARQVVLDLVDRLYRTAEHILTELRLWERNLATATVAQGGAYALTLQGKKEVDSDRLAARNAVRWVIDNQEEGDTYIKNKQEKYGSGKLADLFLAIKWEVGRVDGNKEIRIDFSVGGKKWDRRAGERGQQKLGQSNVALLLERCRLVFEPAWGDMSVTAYLAHNYSERVEELAKRVHSATDYALTRVSPTSEPTMRTAFMRVYKSGLDSSTQTFLGRLRDEVAILFRENTLAEQRARYNAGEDYLSRTGQDSRDAFKLTFVLFGDLLEPEQIAGYHEAIPDYRAFSGRGEQWRTLHILPAETNALQIEQSLSSGDFLQRRREFSEEVVAILEDIDRFRLAVRALAYGEDDYEWGVYGEVGLLFHRHTPRERNPQGASYWRLTLAPEGERRSDGKIYARGGSSPALPIHYHLSPQAAVPDLLEAFIQCVCNGRDAREPKEIDWLRVESTIEQAMKRHLEHWQASGRSLGWRLAGKHDARQRQRLLAEGEDKAAQVIRLNALLHWGRAELEKHRWAWTPEGTSPPENIRGHAEQLRAIQRYVDLWSVILWVAQEEINSLQVRLQALGDWVGSVPNERVIIASDVPPDPEEETVEPTKEALVVAAATGRWLEDGNWLCPNGHLCLASDRFCAECRAPQPPRPDPAEVAPLVPADQSESEKPQPEQAKPEQYPEPTLVVQETRPLESLLAPTEIQKKLDALEQAYQLGAIPDEIYQKQREILQAEATAAAIPVEIQAKLNALENAYQLGALSEDIYQERRQALLNEARRPVITPEMQKKLDALAAAQAMGALDEAQYQAAVARVKAGG